jgi:hypothetical protein
MLFQHAVDPNEVKHIGLLTRGNLTAYTIQVAATGVGFPRRLMHASSP